MHGNQLESMIDERPHIMAQRIFLVSLIADDLMVYDAQRIVTVEILYNAT